MIHEVVEVGTPTAKPVSPLSSKRHSSAKMLAASYQGADLELATKLLTVMMNHVD